MASAKTLLISSLFLFMAACATAPATEDAEEIANREAEFESQRLFEEARLQEQREREAAQRELAEQQALREVNNNNNAQEEARAEPEARSEAQRQADLAEYRRRNDEAEKSSQPSQDVARQQARVAELREQIAVNKSETENLESSNTALREAITAAEELSRTLAAEQEKYSSLDPATGQTVDALAKARIEELKAQIERLRAQAAALSQPAP